MNPLAAAFVISYTGRLTLAAGYNTIMHITVLGASGRVGRLVVRYLLDKEYKVTAFVHSSNPFEPHTQLQVIYGDVHNPLDIEKALYDVDVVISTLGSWGTSTKDVLSIAMKSLIPAMKQHRIHRLVSLTGSAAIAPHDNLRLVDRVNHLLLGIASRKVLRDGEEHIRQLAASDLAWTAVRSPIMRDISSMSYKLDFSAPFPLATVSRQAVARALVDQVESKDFLGKAPYIHSLRD